MNNVISLPSKKSVYVKVSRHDERLWIKVTSDDGDKITGTIANDPLFWPEKFDDEVTVEKSEILQWLQE